MADEADVANAVADAYITNAIEAALGQKRQGNTEQKPSAKFCKLCGEEIDERRRKLGNIQLCFECADRTERRKSRYATY